jgi:hypothetical protein
VVVQIEAQQFEVVGPEMAADVEILPPSAVEVLDCGARPHRVRQQLLDLLLKGVDRTNPRIQSFVTGR